MITFKYNNLPLSEEQQTSELWCWFLSNLSAGLFENITKDNEKFKKLKEFFNEFISNSINSNFLMLLLPTEKVNKNPSFLIGLVSKFFDNNDNLRHNVTITPIGSIPNLEATIIMVNDKTEERINEQDIDNIITDFNDISITNDESSIVSSKNESLYGESLTHFPTRISSITTSDDEFENHDFLILKSILFKDENGEFKTAIRQINEDEDIDDDEEEDWLVYDEQFSLNNLELLNLNDIIYNELKILFYTLEISDSYDNTEGELDDESSLGDDDLEVMEFQGNITYHTDATTPVLLSKTNTLNTFKSVRSELLVHNPDGTYSNIVKSKSEPLNSANKIRKLHSNRKHLNSKASCLIM